MSGFILSHPTVIMGQLTVNIANEQDGIYAGGSTDGLVQSNTGERLVLNVTGDEQGYSGTFNVVVDA